MNIPFLIGLLFLIAPLRAQTTAEQYYEQGSVKSLKAYGKDGGPAAADAAIADLDAAIKLKPAYHEAFNLRANMKLEKGDLEGALADYSKAIALSPKTASYYTNRAQAREKKMDAKGALADMAEVLKLRPKDERAYMNRGDFRLNAKDYPGALKDFDKALELKPSFFAVRRRRAAAYRALGKTEAAEAEEKAYKDESEKFLERFK